MLKGSKMSLKLVCLVLISVFFSGFSSVKASEQPLAITIASPLVLPLEASPGEEIQAKLVLVNPNNYEIKIASEVEDFLVSGEKGTPQFFLESAGKTTLASSIEVEKNFTMIPSETKEVPFVINVSKDAEPGGHYAAVLFKAQLPTESESQLGISGRVGTLVLLTVAGDISKKGEVIEFKTDSLNDGGTIDFSARFKNSGTVHYQPEGKIQIYNWFGKKTGEVALSKHFVLPDSIYDFNEGWSKNFLFGKYRATLEVKDGDGVTHSSNLSFFVFPWQKILLIVALISSLIIALKAKKRIIKTKNTKNRSK